MVCHDLYKNSTFEICCFLFFPSAIIILDQDRIDHVVNVGEGLGDGNCDDCF